LIILEGCDRVGKSTVAHALRKLLPGWSYRHHTKPPCDVYDYFSRFLADAHPRIIVDRCHWSNYTYGHVYGDQSQLSNHQWRLIELMMLSRGSVVLHMTDDIENIKSRWAADEMYKMDEEKFGCILDRYHALASDYADKRSYLPKMTLTLPDLINLKTNKPTELLHAIASANSAQATALSTWFPPSLGCGYTGQGGFLVIGEAPSEDKFANPQVPLDFGPGARLVLAGPGQV
jgi:thymidylate kinase